MKLAMVLCLVLAGACKTDGADQPSSSSTETTAAPSETGRSKARSGKIDLPPRLPNANGARGPERDRPSLDSDLSEQERLERRERRQERRDDRRKERLEMLDTDKDGQISPEEMAAGRKQRAEDMRTRLDENNDGKLTVEELTQGRMGRRLDPATIDTNKDGDISADELNASMEKMRERFRDMRGARGEGWRNRSGSGDSGRGTP